MTETAFGPSARARGIAASATMALDARTKAPKASGKPVSVLRINLHTDTDYTDPALAYYQVSWQFEYATCLKLLNYPDKAGAAGLQLQPEAASSMPAVSSDGKTYEFTIKAGYKFSPPSTEPVTAGTFRHAIERDLNPKMQSPAVSFIKDIQGGVDRRSRRTGRPQRQGVSGSPPRALSRHPSQRGSDSYYSEE